MNWRPIHETLQYRYILRFYVKGDNTEFLFQTASSQVLLSFGLWDFLQHCLDLARILLAQLSNHSDHIRVYSWVSYCTSARRCLIALRTSNRSPVRSAYPRSLQLVAGMLLCYLSSILPLPANSQFSVAFGPEPSVSITLQKSGLYLS